MREAYDSVSIALAGNPNSGKTTIFNRITGAHQHVGNYPGVTVQIKQGRRNYDGTLFNVVDLPGTYSLTALSAEELAARNYLIENRPDVVIDVLDASSLERHLYLGIQLIELGVPLILVLNMSDLATRAGIKFDIPLLSELLGVPIVTTTGTTGEGIDKLLDTAGKLADGSLKFDPRPLSYGRVLDSEIEQLERYLGEHEFDVFRGLPDRWVAIKLLENDEQVAGLLESAGDAAAELADLVEEIRTRLRQMYSDTPEILIAEARYGIISGAATETVRHTIEIRHSLSDRLDEFFLNPVLGIPIFLAMMFIVFTITFRVGEPLIGLFESFFGWLGIMVSGFWPEGAESPLKSLVVDGIIGGVGGVLVFLPNIVILFLAIAFLEDSGYMARGAFIMDRFMHKIGLHGKSFIPMLIGFGCSVPAILGTRILENPRDRLVTIMVIPLMSCSARLPVYTLIIPAFFPARYQGPMLWLIYVLGILLAIGLTKILRGTVFRGESTPFVMELPPYRVPTVQGLLIHSWERSVMYLKKAGTVILAISIILWWATSFPKLQTYSEDYNARLEYAVAEYESGSEDIRSELGIKNGSWGFTEMRMLVMGAEAGDIFEGDDGVTDDFWHYVEKIREIRNWFSRAIADKNLEEDDTAFLMYKNEMASRLEKLEESDPETYRLAERYLNEVYIPFEDEVESIRNKRKEEELTNSYVGRIARGLTPVLGTMGFDWRIGTALLGAFAAKEVFVAQLGIVYSVSETETGRFKLRETLRDNYNPLVGFCIMLFILVSMPCVSTIAATRAETGSWKWALVQLFGLTLLAWAISSVVYQVGKATGIGV